MIVNGNLKRSEHGAHVAGAVVIHYGENDGVHKSNHVLGAVGRDAQQHIRGKNVEEENEVEQAGNVEHGLRDGGCNISQQKNSAKYDRVFFSAFYLHWDWDWNCFCGRGVFSATFFGY